MSSLEKELEPHCQFLELLLASSSQPFYILDAEQRIRYVCQSAEKTELTVGWLGKTLEQINFPLKLDSQQLETLVTTGQPLVLAGNNPEFIKDQYRHYQLIPLPNPTDAEPFMVLIQQELPYEHKLRMDYRILANTPANTLDLQIEQAQQRLELLNSWVRFSPSLVQDSLAMPLSELNNALEELCITTEELKEANDALILTRQDVEAERQRYHSLFDLAPEAYLVTDANGVIQEFNRVAAQLLKVDPLFLGGAVLRNFVGGTDTATFRNHLHHLRLQDPGEVLEWTMQIKPLKEREFPASVRVVMIESRATQTRELRWILRDLTTTQQLAAERQQAEIERLTCTQQEEIDNFKTQIIQNVSHEFRTPLTVIMTAIETIENYSHRLLPEKQNSYFHMIRRSVRKISQMVEDMLVIGNEDTLSFQPNQLNLQSLCLSLIQDYQQLHPDRTITFHTEGILQPFYLDPTLMRQLISHLLSNALTYSDPPTPVDLMLTVEPRQLILQVKDEGIGIPPEEQAHLMEVFYRTSNTADIGGSGMGLSVARIAAYLHHGQLTIESQVGVGTTVTVKIPLVSAKED